MEALSPAFRYQLRLSLLVLICVGVPLWWGLPGQIEAGRAAGIVMGWLGCGLLLTCLWLMLREPRLAAWLGGLERMYRWHHRLGVLAYLCLLVHPLLLAVAEWQVQPARAWALLAPLQEGRAVWSGWAALLCLMVGLYFALMPGEALRYARWRQLHGLLGVAVLLGALHLWWLGIDTPLLALPLLAISLLAWRMLRAHAGLAARPFLVERVTPLARDAVEVSLRPLQAALPVQAGQFVLAAFFDAPGFHGCGEYHPYTVSACDAQGRLALGIKALGDCTRRLQGVRAGVAVRLQGPFGAFLPATISRPSLWLAGGIGITPFMATLRAGSLSAPVHLIYLHRDADDAAYVDELHALAQQQPLLTLVVQASGAALPDLSKLLPQILSDAPQGGSRDCYLCGPPGLVAAARRVLMQRGVAATQIHDERFDFR
ncbi:MAG: ferric reductase-like transmembrane domain-containing protein [Sterolibacterium sp.]|nr:ferric reductase-like transmembrane domain-containing protein [Sterolibacterium sp.]